MLRDMLEFDQAHSAALKSLWFLGDVHGDFRHIAQALLDASKTPCWLVFLGDIDIDHKPFREILEPMRRNFPSVQVAFIHGNHDADTHEHWAMLHDCGDALALHGRVLDLEGVRVAGLGGNFMGRIWSPPAQATFQNKEEAMRPGPYSWRDGERPSSMLSACIYPSDLAALSKLRADILVTHEAPSCHPHGFGALDELARSMRVVRTFHGHHHDDLSHEYAKVRKEICFDARAVSYCSIKNGLGEIVVNGPQGW